MIGEPISSVPTRRINDPRRTTELLTGSDFSFQFQPRGRQTLSLERYTEVRYPYPGFITSGHQQLRPSPESQSESESDSAESHVNDLILT